MICILFNTCAGFSGYFRQKMPFSGLKNAFPVGNNNTAHVVHAAVPVCHVYISCIQTRSIIRHFGVLSHYNANRHWCIHIMTFAHTLNDIATYLKRHCIFALFCDILWHFVVFCVVRFCVIFHANVSVTCVTFACDHNPVFPICFYYNMHL